MTVADAIVVNAAPGQLSDAELGDIVGGQSMSPGYAGWSRLHLGEGRVGCEPFAFPTFKNPAYNLRLKRNVLDPRYFRCEEE
jgi:hypothetical protein